MYRYVWMLFILRSRFRRMGQIIRIAVADDIDLMSPARQLFRLICDVLLSSAESRTIKMCHMQNAHD